MQAGRELDALVAERLGFTIKEIAGIDAGGKTVRLQRISLGNRGHKVIPYYSTSIAAAWELVEEGRKRVSLEVEFSLFANEDGTWDAEFGMNEAVSAPTAPLAICLAFLKATESDRD